MPQRLHQVTVLMRNVAKLKAWMVWFDSDTHITLLTVFYLLLRQTWERYSVSEVLALIVSLGLAFAYGALLSDYYDMPYDKLSGKMRAIYALPRSLVVALIISLLVLGYGVTIIAIGQVLYLLVYTAWIAVGSFYSAPPFRFKHRPVSGILCDSLMEKTLPVSLVFVYFRFFNYDTVVVVLLSFFIQVETIIRHELEDYESDLRTKIKTLVVKLGPDRGRAILDSYARPLSMILILAFSVMASVEIPVFALIFVVALLAYFFIDLLRKKGRLQQERKFLPLHYGHLYFCLQSPFLLFLGFLLTLQFPLYVPLFLIALTSQYPLVKSYIKVFSASIASVTGRKRPSENSDR